MEYKTIVGYEDYLIYEDGSVWSNKSNIFLKPWTGTKGYKFVTLSNSEGSKNFRLHRLVAYLFVENPENKPDVNHKDENKNNNQANNLEWVTKTENNLYGTRGKRSGINRLNNPNCCRKVNQYSPEGELVAQYHSIKEATQKTGITNISRSCIENRMAGGYIWRYENEICTNS